MLQGWGCRGWAVVLRGVVLELYKQEVGKALRTTASAIDARDAPSLGGAAPALKGNSRLVGADRLAYSCDRIEAAARAGAEGFDAMKGRFIQVRGDLDRLLIELNQREGP